MKVLFFSDVHGSPESVTLLRRQIDRLAPEQLVLLGDVLYHGPRNPLRPDNAPQQVVEQLNGLKERITAVRGNCDSEVDQMLLAFPIMSEYATLLADGRRFFLTHGHHLGAGNPPPLPGEAVLGCGHTHITQLEVLENGIVAFNPGSVSLPKGGCKASFGVYEDGTLRICELEFGDEMMSMQLQPS